MLRLAADDEHRLISRGLILQIRKLEESAPRQETVTDVQFTEILKSRRRGGAPILAMAANDAGYPGKLMHDFRRPAATGWIRIPGYRQMRQ